MSQDLLKANLQTLERKLSLLLDKHKSIKDEISLLKEENGELRGLLKQKEEQVNGFQNQIKISKIVSEIDSDGKEATELKSKIDDYIKEIDKCILHLSK
jgi:chromosome segregation ATPase